MPGRHGVETLIAHSSTQPLKRSRFKEPEDRPPTRSAGGSGGKRIFGAALHEIAVVIITGRSEDCT